MTSKLSVEPFIPALARQIQDSNAIAFLNRLQRQPITVPGLVAGCPSGNGTHCSPR
ncbi:MAG: hypothetical protein F6J95_031090 [Leptolyngbya sp. SIO1E4]|nr:hypothetical protein [Leptolyngbya sp. SIO1E4]